MSSETVIIELIPWIDEGAISDAIAPIRAGLEGTIDEDERVIRLRALELLQEGRRRYTGPEFGVWLRAT
ncbi:hypothetical protein [Caulobacter sp. DWR1-3-2b1]|uniref:hypothetical protein n=1 Tax=Caulobacter sp. DWR1-3-2b1 TaxID=2804670 RepID=UPI003CE9F307